MASPPGSPSPPAPDAAASSEPLSAAVRARMERSRLRARALRDAKLVQRGPALSEPFQVVGSTKVLDSGGGFLVEPERAVEAERRVRGAPAPAPLVDEALRPECIDCGERIAASYLLDNFDYAVCDNCREPEGAHALVTRTEAKSEFLLKDCDLDARPPPLRALVRRNPHAGKGAHADMRLYVRAQVEHRAREVWGGEEQLREERERRALRREETQRKGERKRLRALRMDVRSTLFAPKRKAHQHRWGPETHDPDSDTYERECLECGHSETYEKM